MPKAALSSSLTSLLLILTVSAWAADKSKDEETIKNATTVLQAMLSSKAGPDSLLVTADCIIVLPGVKKFAVGVGASGGRGPMTCRDKNFTGSKWSVPAMFTIGGASAGVQLGGSSTDFVLLIMAPAAVTKVLSGKVKVGTDLTAAAGPGATAASSTVGGADILTYGRAKGLFAGISLNGASLESDPSADQRLYDKTVSAAETGTETLRNRCPVRGAPSGLLLAGWVLSFVRCRSLPCYESSLIAEPFSCLFTRCC